MGHFDTIGLIGAMQEEIELYLDRMKDVRETLRAGIHFYMGMLEGKRIVLCKCGVGKVNAAICSQVLIDVFQVEAIIFTGVAGALSPELNIGDIVISTECMQHDMDVTALGFARGIIPYQEHSIFPADQGLIAAAYRASNHFAGRTILGRILSGDQFVADRDAVRELHERLGGVCTEMEGAAVAQTCFMNDVPYVVIRSMSDKADGSADVNFTEFTQLASRHSFEIVEAMLRD